MTVTLTWSELIQAALCGVMRQISSLKAGREDRHGIDPRDGWSAHIEGAAGEMAFAKALGLYFGASINEFKLPDVAGLQVRTRSKDYYDLIVRPDDRDGDVFVLVTGTAPEFVVHGWIRGVEAKVIEPRTYGDRPPAHFVPQAALHSLTELRNAKTMALDASRDWLEAYEAVEGLLR